MTEDNKEKSADGFEYSQLKDAERDELNEAFKMFFDTEYSSLFNVIVAFTGLLLGTLSASRIHPLVNLGIVVVTAVLILRQVNRTEKTSELSKVIARLHKEYPRDAANHSTTLEIDSFNFHRSVSKRIFREASAGAFILCFLVYVIIEHALRYVEYCNSAGAFACLLR